MAKWPVDNLLREERNRQAGGNTADNRFRSEVGFQSLTMSSLTGIRSSRGEKKRKEDVLFCCSVLEVYPAPSRS